MQFTQEELASLKSIIEYVAGDLTTEDEPLINDVYEKILSLIESGR